MQCQDAEEPYRSLQERRREVCTTACITVTAWKLSTV